MSRIPDQQFDYMMEHEYLTQCQRKLQKDKEYNEWLDTMNGTQSTTTQNQLNHKPEKNE